MPLSASTLSDGLTRAFKKTFDTVKGSVDGSPPNIPKVVADELAAAYDGYVTSGSPKAGALSIVIPGIPASLGSAMVAPMMAGWFPGLVAYWTPVIWTGPGFIPINPTIPAALSGIAPEISKFLAGGSHSLEESADKISEILHKYTTQLMVTATTVPPASVVTIVPVS